MLIAVADITNFTNVYVIIISGSSSISISIIY